MSPALRFQVLCLPNVPWDVLEQRFIRLDELGIEVGALPDHFVDWTNPPSPWFEGGGAFLGYGLPEDPGEPVLKVPVDWTFPAIAMDAACRLVPFWRDLAERLTSAEVSVGAGQYTVTADGLPIIGMAPGVEGLFIHGADNGWGIESAPEAGRQLAAIVLAGRDGPDNPYRVDRPSSVAPEGKTVTY